MQSAVLLHAHSSPHAVSPYRNVLSPELMVRRMLLVCVQNHTGHSVGQTLKKNTRESLTL